MRRYTLGAVLAVTCTVVVDVVAAPALPLAGGTTVPVLLVPGWFDSARDMAALRIRLVAAGWPDDYVVAVDFADPTGSNLVHAAELARALHSLRERTGAPQVDVVAHSMGGLATRLLLLSEPRSVRRVVFLASPHRGTYSAYLAWGDGADEMQPGSALLRGLARTRAIPQGVDALTVRTPLDTHILPGENALLPGVRDVSICCPSHAGLLRDAEVFRVVRRFLAAGVVVVPDG